MCFRTYLFSYSISRVMSLGGLRTLVLMSRTNTSQKSCIFSGKHTWTKTHCQSRTFTKRHQIQQNYGVQVKGSLLQARTTWPVCPIRYGVSEASLSSVAPSFVVMRFDQEGNVTTFGKSVWQVDLLLLRYSVAFLQFKFYVTEKKKTELCQELSLQARDLRFQHSTSLMARNNCIIIRMEVSYLILYFPLFRIACTSYGYYKLHCDFNHSAFLKIIKLNISRFTDTQGEDIV